jgi:hypothetical protein
MILAVSDILGLLFRLGFIDGSKNTLQGSSFGLQKVQF